MRQREKDYIERKAPGFVEPTPEQVEFSRNYWQKVFSEPEKKPALLMSRSTACEMDYEVARRKLWEILEERAVQISQIKNEDFRWIFDASQVSTIRNVIRYFINDRNCEWSLSKGLFIYGAPGTTKTELMECIEKFCERYKLTKSFKMCSLSDIYTKAKSNKDYDPITPNVQNDRCFDELGFYMGGVNRYGDQIDIDQSIIEQRYQRMRNYGQLTHFIANATPNELEPSFTPMVFDRLRAMCTSVHFTGKSKRQ